MLHRKISPGGIQNATRMMMKAPKAQRQVEWSWKSCAILGPAKTVAIVGVVKMPYMMIRLRSVVESVKMIVITYKNPM
jgi:hypothetical protein